MTRGAPLPLAQAAARLRRPPGRPRTASPAKATGEPKPTRPPTPILPPRLLTVRGAAHYLSLSVDTIRAFDQRGLLRRVRLPGANDGAALHVVLYDRVDLDALIERSKEPARS